MAARDIIQAAAGAAGATDSVYVEEVFQTHLYTGTGASQTINNGIDLATKGGLVWLRRRDLGSQNSLMDTVRGLNVIYTDSTSSQDATGGSRAVTSFNTNGFTIGMDWVGENVSGANSASWTFRKQPKFFDIVTYTGTGSNRTIAHNLGSTPGMIIVKRTDTSSNWQVYHRSLTSAANSIQLNLTAAQASAATVWNSTAPTSSVFSVGTNATVNASGGTYVAYLFAHDAGGFGAAGTDSVVSCGSFTTDSNGSANVTLGWEHQFVIVKNTGSVQGWFTLDNMRGNGKYLVPNNTAGENDIGSDFITPTATGFRLASGILSNSATYIYLAIRRGPMKTPTDATKVFAPVVATLSAASPLISTGNVSVTDVLFTADRNYAGAYRTWQSRLTGGNFLDSAATSSETASTYTRWDLVGQSKPYNYNDGNHITYNFRRAPGFFDVVCYTGTASVTTRNHNLGVTPELMVIKGRSGTARKWYVYHKSLGNDGTYDYELVLNATDAQIAGGQWLVTNRPTSTTFTNNTFAGTNGSTETYVAYLFATCPGVSKVGSYTGSGTTKQIDCGFAAGARFVLIKRTDSTGDWFTWDSSRGIVSGNDPYLLLNSTAAEVTNTDYIDPYSAGFEISSSAPAAINASGGTFIYLAIA